MKFITLSGVDGSGKSTQLELLRNHLVSQGKKVAYFHAVEFSLANKIVRCFKGEKTFQPGKEKAITQSSWFSLVIKQKFLFIDLLRFRHFISCLKYQKYDYLISDRSFYDSLINLEYLASHHKPNAFSAFLWKFGMRILEKVLIHSDKAFYFDLTPETIMSRERVPEQGAEYLREKISLFKEKKTLWNFIVINAEQTKEAIFQDVLKSL